MTIVGTMMIFILYFFLSRLVSNKFSLVICFFLWYYVNRPEVLLFGLCFFTFGSCSNERFIDWLTDRLVKRREKNEKETTMQNYGGGGTLHHTFSAISSFQTDLIFRQVFDFRRRLMTFLLLLVLHVRSFSMLIISRYFFTCNHRSIKVIR